MWMQLDGKWVNLKSIDFIEFTQKRERRMAAVYISGAILQISDVTEIEKLEAYVLSNRRD